MKKIAVWTAAVLMASILCLADTATLQQVALSRQGDQVVLSLEATDSLVYTAYAGDNEHFIVELIDTAPGPGLARAFTSPALDDAVALEAKGGNVRIILPSPGGKEPIITSNGKTLQIRLQASPQTSLKDVEVTFDGDTPLVRLIGTGLPQPKVERLSGPDRIVLDFSGTLNLNTHGTYFINQMELARVRVSQYQLKPVPVTRVVLETGRPLQEPLGTFDQGLVVRLGEAVHAKSSVSFNRDLSVQEAAPVPQSDQPGTLYEVKKITKTGKEGYVGEPISLNLKDASIKEVLITFAELTGLNFVLDPGVDAKVTVRLNQVPWDQALELILKINNLSYAQDNNILRIAPVSKLAQEAQQKRQLDKEEDLSLPTQTFIKRLSYARAGVIQAEVKKVMSERGDLIVDERTNTLVMWDLDRQVPRILDLIKQLDTPPRQVQIEARIVETTKNFTQQLGIAWGFTGVGDTIHGNTTGLKFPSTYSVIGDVALPSGNTLLDMTFGNILGAFNLDLALSAAEADGLVKIVSSPRVMTQDNLQARIQSGVQIPVQTTANNTTTVTYIDATLNLQVTPQITEAGTISMQINVQKKEPLTGLQVVGGANAPLSTREAQTNVMVKDGGTTVIGGIYQVTDNNSQSRIPFMWRIPILGNLFKNNSIARRHDELLIFITPRVVKSF